MLLIDTDLIVYRTGFGCKNYEWPAVKSIIDDTMYKIIEKCNEDNYVAVISGTGPTFRHSIAVTAPYKGNRKAEKPPFYHEIRQYLKDQWAAVETEGIEADDYMGINCTRKDIICTTDKDLKMIPAKFHYNFVKDTFVKVKRNMYYFWHQLLTGDTADNIIGLKGIGEVKATKLLKGKKLKEMKEIVLREYTREFQENAQARFHENANLLWILRDEKKTYADYI